MWLSIEHRLGFEYDAFIRESWMELRMEARRSAHQTVHSFHLAVGPPTSVSRYVDWNENVVHHFGVADYHDRIEVVARTLVHTHTSYAPLAHCTAPPTPPTGPLLDFIAFGGPVLRSPRLEKLALEIAIAPSAPLGEQVAVVGSAIKQRFRYQPGVTHAASDSDEIQVQGAGVCQDFAHLMLALLRLRRIPCRYVSGYLHVEVGAEEVSQSHAWVEVHDPERGWVAFDPTHEQVPDERYVVVGHGRHYDDVPPNRGVFLGKAREHLTAEVKTLEVDPRPVTGLQEETARIEVPVYRELPGIAPVRGSQGAADEQKQQQQQQQQ